jgi:hypothetical protein
VAQVPWSLRFSSWKNRATLGFQGLEDNYKNERCSFSDGDIRVSINNMNNMYDMKRYGYY